jgi:hypothetical protein
MTRSSKDYKNKDLFKRRGRVDDSKSDYTSGGVRDEVPSSNKGVAKRNASDSG